MPCWRRAKACRRAGARAGVRGNAAGNAHHEGGGMSRRTVDASGRTRERMPRPGQEKHVLPLCAQRGLKAHAYKRHPSSQDNGEHSPTSTAHPPFVRQRCAAQKGDPRLGRRSRKRHQRDCRLPRSRPSLCRWISRQPTAAGVTPEMRPAWPRLRGRTRSSFSSTSRERPAT